MRTAAPLLLLLAAASAGCGPKDELPPAASEQSTADGLTPEQVAVVEAACSRCHALPPPEALSKGAMIEQVHAMFGLSAATGMPSADLESIVLAQRYYRARSPESLEPVPQADGISDRVRFSAMAITPRFYEQNAIPATSNVRFESLLREGRQEVVFTEMRSRSVLFVAPWQPEAAREVYAAQLEMNYPVQTHPVDLNRDGLSDLLVASIGAMRRDNSRKGSISVLLRTAEGPWEAVTIAEGLARPVAIRALDADGDGDLDLVVAAFGWMGPGALVLYENRTQDWSSPVFVPHALDERDGFIRIETADLDGDGREDFVAAVAQEQEQVVAFLNRGDLSFESRVLYQGLHPAWGTSGLQLVDFDADGDLDALVTNGDTLDDNELKPYHGVRWLENRGGLDFASHWIGTCYGCEQAVAGDVDGDGDLDVVAAAWLPQLGPAVWAQRDIDSVLWFERLPLGWRRRAIEKHACYHPTVAVGDHDGDGKLDVAVGNFIAVEDGGAATVLAPALTVFTQQ